MAQNKRCTSKTCPTMQKLLEQEGPEAQKSKQPQVVSEVKKTTEVSKTTEFPGRCCGQKPVPQNMCPPKEQNQKESKAAPCCKSRKDFSTQSTCNSNKEKFYDCISDENFKNAKQQIQNSLCQMQQGGVLPPEFEDFRKMIDKLDDPIVFYEQLLKLARLAEELYRTYDFVYRFSSKPNPCKHNNPTPCEKSRGKQQKSCCDLKKEKSCNQCNSKMQLKYCPDNKKPKCKSKVEKNPCPETQKPKCSKCNKKDSNPCQSSQRSNNTNCNAATNSLPEQSSKCQKSLQLNPCERKCNKPELPKCNSEKSVKSCQSEKPKNTCCKKPTKTEDDDPVTICLKKQKVVKDPCAYYIDPISVLVPVKFKCPKKCEKNPKPATESTCTSSMPISRSRPSNCCGGAEQNQKRKIKKLKKRRSNEPDMDTVHLASATTILIFGENKPNGSIVSDSTEYLLKETNYEDNEYFKKYIS